MSERHFNLILTETKRDLYDQAMADVLCWLNGFTSAGKEYSPGSLHVLRDLADDIKRAYGTIAPADVPRVEPPHLELVRQIRNRAIQSIGVKNSAVVQQKIQDIKQIADAIFELPKV